MRRLARKVYITAGYNTTYFGRGRKDFNPDNLPPFENYLKETAEGTAFQASNPQFDEGLIGSFMSGRFLNQANLPGFLPYMVPSLHHKPCTGIEGACGTGGRTIAMAVRSILSGLSDSVFVAGFEMQNSLKAIYGADVLAGAAYYKKERKEGHAFFFPGVFSERAGAYYDKYGYNVARPGMAAWYQQMILNARKNPKAQEFQNNSEDLYKLGMSAPDPSKFVPFLNYYDCSKISDGASSLLVVSEEGMAKCGIRKEDCIEVIALGEAEDDITKKPYDLTQLLTTRKAVQKALDSAEITIHDLGLLEIHDCFTITALMAFEALGFAEPGKAAAFIRDGKTAAEGMIPTNLSGGLCGFGHPTGATGVRQMVDLLYQLIGKADNQVVPKQPYGMMISMGGNDKTVTSIIVKSL